MAIEKNQGAKNRTHQKKLETQKTAAHNSLRLVSGEVWPEVLDVRVERIPHQPQDHFESSAKTRASSLLASSFILLLFALTFYAMVTSDHNALAQILSIDKYGLVIVAVWATGKSALRILSGWKDVG